VCGVDRLTDRLDAKAREVGNGATVKRIGNRYAIGRGTVDPFSRHECAIAQQFGIAQI
jgi:hypothetical protein